MDLKLNVKPSLHLSRFEKYEIKEINKIKYIIPVKENNSLTYVDTYVPDMLVDLLNIGKNHDMFDFSYEDCEEQVLNFVNKYGLLGFIRDLPINEFFFLDSIVVLKDFDATEPLNIENKFTVENYFKLFFPNYSDSKITKLIKDLSNLAVTEHALLEIKEKISNLLFDADYAEPLSLIVAYADLLYSILVDEDGPFLDTFYLSHSNFRPFSFNDETKVVTQIKYMKQVLDLNFLSLITQKPLLLKICKHCEKVFIAKNPKAEYDTPQCKNQANVYKSREKNK